MMVASTPKRRPWCSWSRASFPQRSVIIIALVGLIVSLVLFTIRPAASKWFTTEDWQRPSTLLELPAQPSALPAAFGPEIKPDDLWAVHDLLLLGYKAPFMKEGSAGQREVRAKAEELASLLPKIHPFEPCRQQIQAAYTGGRAGVIAASQASWACLPRKFSPAMFTAAFTPEGLDQPTLTGLADKARNPKLLDTAGLSACAATEWPRTCSLWASIHSMAYRADALGLGTQFRDLVLAVLAGGATMCGGCTLHLRALHETVLSPAILSDLGDLD